MAYRQSMKTTNGSPARTGCECAPSLTPRAGCHCHRDELGGRSTATYGRTGPKAPERPIGLRSTTTNVVRPATHDGTTCGHCRLARSGYLGLRPQVSSRGVHPFSTRYSASDQVGPCKHELCKRIARPERHAGPDLRRAGGSRSTKRGRQYELTDIDSKGSGKCSDSFADLILLALDFIDASGIDGGQIPVACTPNRNIFKKATKCFGGHGLPDGTTNPRSVVKTTLHDATIDFQIHRNTIGCTKKSVAFTDDGQWKQAVQDIHICARFLSDVESGTFGIDTLACVIVHEIYHVWGADESGADGMEPPAWTCFL